MMAKQSATGCGISAVLMWGLLALLGSSTTGIPAFQLLFICFVISAGIMFFQRLLQKKPLLAKPELSLRSWLLGIVGLFGFHFCYFMALKLAPAMEVSLIVYLWPLLLTVFVAQQGARLTAFIGGGIGFVGIALLILSKDNAEAANSDFSIAEQTLGYVLAFSCAGIWSGYSWYLSKVPGKVEDIGWLSLAVAGFSLLAHLTLEPVNWQLSANEWLGALLLGLGPVGGAFYLWDIGMKRGNQTLLASFSFAAPLITAISLVIAGVSDWSLEILIALGLVMLGAGIANRKGKLQEKQDSVQESAQERKQENGEVESV